MYSAYLSGALASATIPEFLWIAPVQAWAVILTFFAVCGGLFWLLARSAANRAADDRAGDVARAHRQSSPRLGDARRPQLHPIAHHGSRAA